MLPSRDRKGVGTRISIKAKETQS